MNQLHSIKEKHQIQNITIQACELHDQKSGYFSGR
jgi:hypothetical protein